MKKNIILKNAGGELANQLWNYVSIYAYSLEVGARTYNPAFFEYHNFFNLLKNENYLTRLFSMFFQKPQRRNHWINKVFRFKYKILIKIICLFNKNNILSSENKTNVIFYLPPSKELATKTHKQYFLGWLFRNPVGLEKYRNEIIEAFKPKFNIERKINNIISEQKKKYSCIIGLHIRQGDYKIFRNGKYLIDQYRARQICHEYIENKKLNNQTTLFIITSDGKIDPEIFNGLNIYISKENAIADLFLLSKTEGVIGSDSSFGHFASWYGNIPHIVLKNETIDWNYYQNKNKYFTNKYLELLPL